MNVKSAFLNGYLKENSGNIDNSGEQLRWYLSTIVWISGNIDNSCEYYKRILVNKAYDLGEESKKLKKEIPVLVNMTDGFCE